MNSPAPTPDVKQIYDTWISGYASGDSKKVMSVFDRGLRYSKPCQPEQTFESLTAWFEFDFRRQDPRPSWTYEIESIDVGGDLAVVVSQWTGATNFGGFSAHVERLRSIDVLRFGTEGWKIIRTINDSLPCNAPVKTTMLAVAGGKLKLPKLRGRRR
jgi:ketosteroid isomerase-like protein